MKSALRVLYIFLFGALSFFIGTQYEWLRTSGNHPVSVTIINESGHEIKSLTLFHSAYGLKGSLNIDPPPNGSSKIIRFFQPGDGSFTIEATFTNGQVLQGVGGYVESGYSLYMVITATGISRSLDGKL